MHQLTITTIQTTISVAPNELEAVKKAVSSWLKLKGFTQHGFFHNHESEEDPDYKKQEYPLIQFRCPNGLLMLWGLQQGAGVLQNMMLHEMLRGFQYKGMHCRVDPTQTGVQQHELGFAENSDLYTYELNYFVALTAANFKSWQHLPDAAKRMERLQQLLANNIAMFCRAAGFVLDKSKLVVQIYWVWHARWVIIKEHKVLAFTLSYQSNLVMPDGIALGRQTRLGYGWQTNRPKSTAEPEPIE